MIPTFDYAVSKARMTCGARTVFAVPFQGREYEIDIEDPRVVDWSLTHDTGPGMIRTSEPVYEFE